MPTLREIADTSLEKAKSLVSQGEELMPVFVFGSDEAMHVAGMPHYSNNRGMAIAMMKVLLEADNATQYVFIMEAWFGVFDAKEDPRKKDPDYLPSKDPQRKECVCVVGRSRDGESVFLLVEIKREGQKISFGEMASPSGIALSILDNLFETRKPH